MVLLQACTLWPVNGLVWATTLSASPQEINCSMSFWCESASNRCCSRFANRQFLIITADLSINSTSDDIFIRNVKLQNISTYYHRCCIFRHQTELNDIGATHSASNEPKFNRQALSLIFEITESCSRSTFAKSSQTF